MIFSPSFNAFLAKFAMELLSNHMTLIYIPNLNDFNAIKCKILNKFLLEFFPHQPIREIADINIEPFRYHCNSPRYDRFDCFCFDSILSD